MTHASTSAISDARARDGAGCPLSAAGSEPLPARYDGQDIYELADEVARSGGLRRVRFDDGVTAWSVGDAELAKRVLVDPRFSRDGTRWLESTDGRVPTSSPSRGWASMDNISTKDGAEHERLRPAVVATFTQARVAAYQSLVEETVHDAVANLRRRVAEDADALVDLLQDFALPVATSVFNGVVGMNDAEDPSLAGSRVNTDYSSSEDMVERMRRLLEAIGAFLERRTSQGERREAIPDITDELLAAEHAGDLSREDVIRTLHFLRASSTVPTSNLIATAVVLVATQPEVRRSVLDGGTSWDDVLDEVLRNHSPVAHLPFRYATEDVDLGGTVIPAGDAVLVNYLAIGRGATRSDGAGGSSWDQRRPPTFAFGHGPHRCPGSALARLEARVALETLFTHFPNLEVELEGADGPQECPRQPSFVMLGPSSVPARLGDDRTGERSDR